MTLVKLNYFKDNSCNFIQRKYAKYDHDQFPKILITYNTGEGSLPRQFITFTKNLSLHIVIFIRDFRAGKTRRGEKK